MSEAGGTRPVHIVTDSTADIPPELLNGLPITVVPLTIELRGEVYRDGIDMTRDDLLGVLQRGDLPRTSQPAIGTFQEIYRDLIGQGFDVVAVHIGSRFSGTHNASRSGAQAVASERIRVIDSETVSMGFGWLALEAAERAKRGDSLDAIADVVEARKADQRVLATLETLEYLQRGGRIGRASALLGSALQIKPLISIRGNEIEPLERVRTFPRAIDRLAALGQAEMPFDHLAVLHLGAPENAAKLADRLAAAQPGLEITRAQVGTVIGVYGGPGLVGFAGLVAPRSSS